MKNLLSIVILVLTTQISLAQQKHEVYYESSCEGCIPDSTTAYNRIYYTDESGSPDGEIFDFYPSGELRAKISGATYIDHNDDSKSRFVGYSVGYYKSGLKKYEAFYDEQGRNTIHHKIWHDNGMISYEMGYKNDKFHGFHREYYRSGKLKSQSEYENGQDVISSHEVRCDEDGRCYQYIHAYQEYTDTENKLSSKGLVGITNKSLGRRYNLSQYISSPDFSIVANMKFGAGMKNNGYGLLWDKKDSNNYHYLHLDSKGVYTLGTVEDGRVEIINSKKVFEQGVEHILKIYKRNDRVYFTIDEMKIHETKSSKFSNPVDFYVPHGENEVNFINLIVEQDLDSDRNHLLNSLPTR